MNKNVYRKDVKICPKINNICLETKCKFWIGLYNSTTKELDYDCLYVWNIYLKLEQNKSKDSNL